MIINRIQVNQNLLSL